MTSIDALVSKLALHRDVQMRALRSTLEALLTRQQRGMVLADEVGCGKTYEALGAAALLWLHHRTTGAPLERILVVADGALMTKWFNEIEVQGDARKGTGARKGFLQYVEGPEWAEFRAMLKNVERLESRRDGDKAGTREQGRLQVPKGIYITKPRLLTGSAEDAGRYIRYLRNSTWDLMIVDEAHNFTNLGNQRSKIFFPDGKATSRAEGLSARYVLALTATPFQLSTTELLHLLRIVHASSTDLEALSDALPRFERALEGFYAKRHLPPDAAPRQSCVEALANLRTKDACGGRSPGTPGLETLLRRYVVRNVKDPGQRAYAVTERANDVLSERAFHKLADVRSLVADSPLLPLRGTDAWVYMQAHDLIDDAGEVAAANEKPRPTFVAGDLRQCLSSYEQLEASSLASRADLPRAAGLRTILRRLSRDGHVHPKIAALKDIVDRLVHAQLEAMRDQPARGFDKILVFNTLMHTAARLNSELESTVAARVDPFLDEMLLSIGFAGVKEARAAVQEALVLERNHAKDRLGKRFDADHLMVDRELLVAAGLETSAARRHIADVMFGRALNHCTQKLFLLRMALKLRHDGEGANTDAIRHFLMMRVGEKLTQSLDRIVDDYLDDTPATGIAFSAENRGKAQREITRLAHILGEPNLVGRFDGTSREHDREMRKENFNRPYAPLVLLVSKVGEEGIDLQAHTKYVLHYDVEWNPAKMEQREGRVDREGRDLRKGAVHVQFFLLKDTYEERVFHTVMQRHAWFEVLIGSKKKELAKGVDADEDEKATGFDAEEETGTLTARERERVMLNLQP